MEKEVNEPIYSLKNKWTLWFHRVEDTDWKPESYMNIFTLNNLKDFHLLFNTIQNFTAGMFFLMKENIMPLWEDINNVNGGMFSYKINKKYANNVWKEIVAECIGNVLSKNMENINGISISPKLDNCIIKIWINNKHFNNPKLICSNNNLINSLNSFFIPCQK